MIFTIKQYQNGDLMDVLRPNTQRYGCSVHTYTPRICALSRQAIDFTDPGKTSDVSAVKSQAKPER